MWQGLVMTTLRQRVGARRWRFIVPGAILVALVSAGIIVIGNETSDPAGPSLAAALEIVCSPGTRSADTGPLTGTVAGGNCRSKVDPGVPLYYGEYLAASTLRDSVGSRPGVFATAHLPNYTYAAIACEHGDRYLLKSLADHGWALGYAIE
ncbi:hypothetical protein ACVWY6_002810 [Williamsia sp. R60]